MNKNTLFGALAIFVSGISLNALDTGTYYNAQNGQLRYYSHGENMEPVEYSVRSSTPTGYYYQGSVNSQGFYSTQDDETNQATLNNGNMRQQTRVQDQQLAQKIRDAIAREPSFSQNARSINVMSTNGKVTLNGAVASEQEKTKIGAIVRRIEGVRNLDNQLQILKGDAYSSNNTNTFTE